MRACTDLEVFVLDKDPVDAIACGAYISRGKPAPSVLEIARRRVRAGGDTPYDAQAAARSASYPVGVLTGHLSERKLLDAGCRVVVRDPVSLGRLSRARLLIPGNVSSGVFGGRIRLIGPGCAKSIPKRTAVVLEGVRPRPS